MEFDLVSIVAAPRGLPSLRRLLADLPSGFGAPIICLVQARPRLLDELRSQTRLRVEWAEAGVPLEPGTVYISRPGTSLVCRPDKTLSITPFGLESSALNPVDQFLASAAGNFGRRLISLVLAGFDQDGAAGAEAVRRHGSSLAVLERATAEYWGVAEPMVRAGGVQRTLTIAEVANALRACFTGADLLRCAEIQIQLGIVLDAALAASGTHMGHIARRAGELAGLRIVAERGLDIRYIERMDPIPPREHTAPGRTLITGERSLIDDVLADERCAPQHDLARAFGYRGEHALPLIIGAGRIEGTLVTLHPEPLGHDTGRVGALDRYAREAAALVAAFP